MVKSKIKKFYKKGYLSKIVNPLGKKKAVYIYQGRKDGFSASYVGSNTRIKGSSRNAEAYASKLAKKGHKKVTFKD